MTQAASSGGGTNSESDSYDIMPIFNYYIQNSFLLKKISEIYIFTTQRKYAYKDSVIVTNLDGGNKTLVTFIKKAFILFEPFLYAFNFKDHEKW
jgi:hypothetical protein